MILNTFKNIFVSFFINMQFSSHLSIFCSSILF